MNKKSAPRDGEERLTWWVSPVLPGGAANAVVWPEAAGSAPDAMPMQLAISHPMERFLAYLERNRTRVFVIASVLFAAILFIDWKIVLDRSMGYLYILPIILVAGALNNYQILLLAGVCAILREQFTPEHWDPGAWYRILTGFCGFVLTGFFVSELNRERRMVLEQLRQRDEQARLREEAVQQTRVLIETSPLAILTLDSAGHVVLANQSAHDLLGFASGELPGKDISELLPILPQIVRAGPSRGDFRTALECRGQRRDGGVFLAHVWLSTYNGASGTRLAAVVWDASENLRDREGTGLDSMMSVSRVLVGAVSHEIRNLAAAGLAAWQRLERTAAIETSESFLAVGATLRGLERIASSGLAAASKQTSEVTDLATVLDETRIVIEESIHDIGGVVDWDLSAGLPLVRADQHSLLQVFLNLARNSERAMRETEQKDLRVEAHRDGDVVLVKFRDTGSGVTDPESLFQPFQPGAHSSGLGLYISRAILRACGGDLRYEPEPHGSCFVVELWPSEESEST